ncbi:Uncharacterized protein FWK35_00033511 [Aphis craccivora]|uniref:Uncharacterized protein n=1 Tax=Aphis craccivora TaxID=307492 RepID=A0A6G0VXV6_APHCR|nr:Uncharacterized protein FWK35_00033511 [Aphis craccivora]
MTSSGANCLPQDTMTILSVSSNIKKPNENENEYVDMLCAQKDDDDPITMIYFSIIYKTQ